MNTTTDWSRNYRVEVDGDEVGSHAGNVITRMLADRVGLTDALSAAISRPEVVHDRGALLRDVAVSIGDGATNLSGSRVLRDQERLFGEVASLPTMWRGLNEIDNGALVAITAARNKVRERVWELIAARHGRIPPVRTCYGDLGPVICIRIDASLIEAHSDKQHAAGNFKGGYGFHPLLAWCDNTGELLAVIPRAGNAGSNTAADHVAIIDAAIAAIPAKYRRNLLITIDGAGSSHKVVEHLSALNNRPGWSVAYSVGFDLDERVRAAIGQTPAQAWEDALDARGAARDDAAVTDLTGILRHSHPGDTLAGWPPDMRVLVRREDIEDGAQLSLFEQLNGHRYQPMATNTAGGHPQRLEARHRVHARVEGFIRCGKATGLARWPSNSFAINTAWVAAVTIAIDLLCWTRLLLLDGPLAAAEPATLRYRLLHAAVRIIDHARRRILRVPETWSWAQDFTKAFHRVLAIPDQQTLSRRPQEGADHHRDRGTRRYRTTRGAQSYPLTKNQHHQHTSRDPPDHGENLRLMFAWCKPFPIPSASPRPRPTSTRWSVTTPTLSRSPVTAFASKWVSRARITPTIRREQA